MAHKVTTENLCPVLHISIPQIWLGIRTTWRTPWVHLENSPRDFDSVGLGGTHKTAFLISSQMPMLLVRKPHFANHYSTLPHSPPLVLVLSHQTSSKEFQPHREFLCLVWPSGHKCLCWSHWFGSSSCGTWSSLTRTVFKKNPEKGPNRPCSHSRGPSPAPHSSKVGGVSSLFARSKKETLPHQSSIGRTAEFTGVATFHNPTLISFIRTP